MGDGIVTGLEAVAEHFGKSVRQVRRWVKAGMPRLSGKRFDLLQIQAWRDLAQGIEITAGAAGGDPRQPFLPDERGKDFWDGRSKKFQAMHRELDYRARLGELVERREVDRLFEARILAVKQGLTSLSRALPPQLATCQGEREMEPIIHKAVHDLLNAFARPLPENIGAGAGPNLDENAPE